MFSSLSLLWSTRKKSLLAIGAALGGVVLTFLFLTFLAVKDKNTTNWKSAAVAAPPKLVSQVIEQNYQGADEKLDISRVRVLPIHSQASKLYIFDFNTPSLCGIGGCLYVVYTESGTPVLRLLLQPGLPKGVPLFAVAGNDKTQSGYPCLVVSQTINSNKINSTTTENQRQSQLLSKSLYCYSGSGFARFNHSVTELSTKG